MDHTKLQSIPLFGGLGKHELEAVARSADEVDIRPGEHLAEEGDFGHEFFTIVSGRAEVRHGDDVIATLEPGDFFGEQALAGDARRNASVVATSPMVAVVMTRSAFHQLRRDHPLVCDRIEAVVRDRGRETAQN